MKEILKQVRKADQDYQLMEDNDHIIVGVSGGKDSMVLLTALHIYQKFKHKNFMLTAVHLKMGFDNMSSIPIQEYCMSNNINFIEEVTPIYDILKHYPKQNQRIDCSRCSNLKRGAIVRVAKRIKANKIAFAHHADDAIETFFMNMLHGANLSVFQPKIWYEDNQINFIRPFLYVNEKDIIHTVNELQIPIVKSTCPNDGKSERAKTKKLLQHMYKTNKYAKHNIMKALREEHYNPWYKKTRQ